VKDAVVSLVLLLLLVCGGFVMWRHRNHPTGGTLHIRVTSQYGMSYLPLAVAEDRHLIEKHAEAMGLKGFTVEWTTLGNGSAAADALLSNSANFCAVGVAQLVMLWDKTNGDVRGIAAICSSPLFLNTVNPNIHTIKDFTDSDRIALPASKVSIQAVVLEMAAAKLFGDAQYDKLDKLTMPMKHPDGMAAMLGGNSEVTAHFTSSPFQEEELKNSRVHRVLNSYDVLGPHTHIVLMATRSFHDANAKACDAVLAAIEEADGIIKKDPHSAIDSYLRVSRLHQTPTDALKELQGSGLGFSTSPESVEKIAKFMQRVGVTKKAPATWKDLFFDETHARAGS
jgi:NitT/TauT family transport system substrate-binding protein